MHQGRGGMGSKKHGRSGDAGKSPKLREYLRREAEKNVRGRRPLAAPATSVQELLTYRRNHREDR